MELPSISPREREPALTKPSQAQQNLALADEAVRNVLPSRTQAAKRRRPV